MQTKTLVAPSAEMVRIVTLQKGDVYKRLVKDPYDTSKKKIVIGTVEDVLHNGETAAITALEVTEAYGVVEIRAQAFSGDDDLSLYPVSTDEATAVIDEALAKQRAAVDTKRNDLARAEEMLSRLSTLRERTLTQPTIEQVVIEAQRS